MNRVVLYDRINLDDQVLGGRLVFSDNSSIPVGSLNNDGTATTVILSPAKLTTSVQFVVDNVSITTKNIGLAEIEIIGSPIP